MENHDMCPTAYRNWAQVQYFFVQKDGFVEVMRVGFVIKAGKAKLFRQVSHEGCPSEHRETNSQ